MRCATILVAAVVLGFAALVAFALEYPPLTGRVVDQANVISAQSRGALETKLKELEDKSSIQLVVATVKSLQGSDIETYANGLFRFWKLGQAQKNNGVLLLVAPAEHKVRIEVGYGLEGTLTDALSSVIIASAVSYPVSRREIFPVESSAASTASSMCSAATARAGKPRSTFAAKTPRPISTSCFHFYSSYL